MQQGLNEGVQQHAEGALWAASALFLGTTLIDWFVTWAYTRYTGRTAERLLFALRIRIFAHLQRLALDYYDRELSGRIMTRMTTDVDAFAQLLQTGLITALVNILSFVGVLVVLSFLSWPLTLGVLVLVPPLVLATIWFGRRSAHGVRARPRDDLHRQRRVPGEHLGRARGAGVRAGGPRRRLVHDATAQRYLDARIRTQVLQAIYFPFILFLATCGDAIVLGLGERARARRHHRRRHRDRVPALPRPVLRAGAAAVAGVRPVAAGGGVDDQDQRAHAHAGVRRPTPRIRSTPARCAGDVRFEDVRFSYPTTGRSRRCTASTCTSRAGETVALVGETGAGKSTLVKLVARFYDADSGDVLIDGVPVRDLDLRAYRRRLGYVPQEAFLFSGTVRDNIAYGRPDATDAEVEHAARAVGAHDFIAGLRGGYLHPVTERGRSLSAGQRQLLCLARALLVDPAILLLDEATANLDLSTEARVQRAMGVDLTRPHHAAHRPPPADRAHRRPHRGGRRRSRRRGRHPRRAGGARRRLRRALEPQLRRLDLRVGGVAALVAAGGRVLLGLEHLVDVEEVLDLVEQPLRQVADVVDGVVVGVVRRHAEDLGVGPLLVLHPEHADRAHLDPAARERGVLEEHEHVEGIAVDRERVGDEPVVGRVHRGREQAPVEPDDVLLVVVLVLVAAAARDLDDDVERRARDQRSAGAKDGGGAVVMPLILPRATSPP